jgi:hypothetical protein
MLIEHRLLRGDPSGCLLEKGLTRAHRICRQHHPGWRRNLSRYMKQFIPIRIGSAAQGMRDVSWR